MNQKQIQTTKIMIRKYQRLDMMISFHKEEVVPGVFLIQAIFGKHWFDRRSLTFSVGKRGGVRFLQTTNSFVGSR